jgi:hypothetical protein
LRFVISGLNAGYYFQQKYINIKKRKCAAATVCIQFNPHGLSVRSENKCIWWVLLNLEFYTHTHTHTDLWLVLYTYLLYDRDGGINCRYNYKNTLT